MAVRDALLVLLLNGPAYGFQLHGSLGERTGGRRQVNVGQIYSTLDRLSGRGLVESAGATDDGLPLYRITAAGRAAAETWLAGDDAMGADPWHETVDRVLIALSMPAVEGARVVGAERARWTGRRDAAAAALGSSAASGVPGARQRLVRLSAAADLAAAESALGWLDEVARADAAELAFSPSPERPRRGRRPARPGEGGTIVSAGHATEA